MADGTKLVTIECPNHHDELIKALWHFFTTMHRVDLSFSTGTGRTVSAHHLVADAFLLPGKLTRARLDRKHLRRTEDGRASSLEALLEFMYKGSVTLPEDRLEHLLDVAGKLEFKMLVEAIDSAASRVLDAATQMRIERKMRSARRRVTVADEVVPEGGEGGSDVVSDAGDAADGDRTFEPPQEAEGVVTELDQRRHKCKLCQLQFANRERFKYHLFHSHQINIKGEPVERRRCSQCKFTCRTPSQLRTHTLIKHSGLKPFSCPHKNCSYTTGTKSSVGVHLRFFHLKVRPYLCADCGFAAYSSNQLKVHVRSHTGEKPFQCQTCGTFFRRTNGLKRHEQEAHGIGGTKLVSCTVCSKIFNRRTNLIFHLKRIHRIEEDVESYVNSVPPSVT